MSGITNFRQQLHKVMSRRKPSLLFDLILNRLNQLSSPALRDLMDSLQMISSVQLVDPGERTLTGYKHAVTSAALLRRNSKYFLCFNEEFLVMYMTTIDDLCHLVLHELSHKLKGDLRRCVRSVNHLSWSFVNITADILNDAFLRREFFPEPPKYLRLLYDKKDYFQILAPPEVLLNLPYERIEKTEREVLVNMLRSRLKHRMMMTENDYDTLARLYFTAWLDNPSFDAVFTQLSKLLESYTRLHDIDVFFLGNHEMNYYIYDYWEHWFFSSPAGEELSKEGGRGGPIREKQITYMIDAKKSKEILESIRKSLDKGIDGFLSNQRLLPEIGVVPFLKRREIFLINGGFRPLFYPNPVFRREENESKVNLYLDVSGSVERYLPFLYGLIVQLKNEISEPLYLFSNHVVPVNLGGIKEGFVKTSGGTDFDCVAEHALNHRFRKILVITDGYARFEIFKEKLQENCEVYVVLTRRSINSKIIEVAGGPEAENKKWWVLPDEGAE